MNLVGSNNSKNRLFSVIFPLASVLCSLFSYGSFVLSNEVLVESPAEIVVREHPKTGIPYVSIIDAQRPRALFTGDMKKYNRPDYRMLDPKVRSKDVHYDGPVSDRKKVYILAGALAAGGIAGYAALPVSAAGGTAAGGAGAYAAASGAVTAGTFSTHWALQRDERPDDFTQTAVSREIPLT